MEQSDDAECFRYLLAEKLAEEGFTVVTKEAEADAKLTGVRQY